MRRSGGYMLVAASVAGAALGNALAYKVIAVLGTPDTLGAYTLARRYLSFLVPVLALGGGVTLPLLVARGMARTDGLRLLYYYCLGAVLVVSVILGLSSLVPGPIFGLLPGLRAAVAVGAVTSAATGLLYGYLRGHESFLAGGVVLILANGAFPLTSALTIQRGTSAPFLLWATGNALVVSIFFWRFGWPGFGRITEGRRLARRSIMRVCGDIALVSLYVVPVAMMSGIEDGVDLVVFNYHFVLVGFITAVATPIGIVLLPRMSAAVAGCHWESARTYLRRTIVLSAGVAALMFALFNSMHGLIIEVLLSDRYLGSSTIIGRLAPSAAGFALFVLLKGVIDGASERPLTAWLSAGALILFVVATSVADGLGLQTVINATNLAFGVLGVTSLAMGLVTLRAFTKESLACG